MKISFRKQADIKTILDKRRRSQNKDFRVGDRVRFEDWDGSAGVMEEISTYGSGNRYTNEKIRQYRKGSDDFNQIMDDPSTGVVGYGLGTIFYIVKFEDGSLDMFPKEYVEAIV